MTDDELAKRFEWWWRNPAKALRRAFPKSSSEEAIQKYQWPGLERAALNYELVARRNGRREYLLGKRFDHLTRGQMFELAGLWPRQSRRPEPIRVFRYAESVAVAVTGRTASLDDRWELEKEHAQRTGWTVPRYFTINLKGCRDRAIVEAFRKHIAAQRKFLEITPPRMNKGFANKGARGLSFQRIEALDVWTHLPHGEAKPNAHGRGKLLAGYSDALAWKARREARRLSEKLGRPGKQNCHDAKARRRGKVLSPR